MAAVEKKSRGLKFAEQQLLRHGWEHGKGLGRAENGIAEAIKVKVKCDKGGVGHKEGEQFTFQWWDHVFNKASSNLQVESDHNGIHLKKTVEEDEEDGMISNKKPRKASLAKAKLYGCFVKSATLLSGQEQPEPKSLSSDDSSSSSSEEEEEDQKLDLSSAINLSDADLMRVCGGRTAHKGARHGLTMSAKLARLEQQEAEFMAKYGKKSEAKASPATPPASQATEEQQEEETQEGEEEPQAQKKKKKRSSINELNGGDVCERTETDVKAKKKQRKAEEDDIVEISDDSVICVGDAEADHSPKTKKKRKKKKSKAEQKEEEAAASAAAESPEEAAPLHSFTKVKRKKKKKKKSSEHHSEPAEEEEESNDAGATNQQSGDQSEEAEVPREENTADLQIKKRKKAKHVIVDNTDKETLPAKKKKKSKN